MSDTPRTEAFIKECTSGKLIKYVGPADISNLLVFARTLERELTAEQKRYDELRAILARETARGDRLEKALRDHNDECQALCGIGDQEAVRCGYRPYLLGSGRRCPECPTYMMIECAALGDSNG